jgi:UrcA family protein
MKTKLNAAFAIATLVTTLALSSPSRAQTPDGRDQGESAPSQVVRFSDLDLSSATGIRTLYGRIQNAAWRVCRQIVLPQSGATGIENGKCRHTLIDIAVEQVNREALTALHTGKNRELIARR